MIEARHLAKRYGHTVAVDEAPFVVRPGRVTGFLGPNGAGKSTTMRMILGLDTPSSGSVLIDGQPYRELTDPLPECPGPGRTAGRPGRCPERRGALLDSDPGGALVVTGLDAAAIGAVACAHDISLVELATHSATLEEAFFYLARDETDYHAGQLAGAGKGN